MNIIIKKKAGIAILLTGITFVIVGVLQNDYHDTLSKAVRICLECIGIG